MQHEYRPGLTTRALIVEVRRLLATASRTECTLWGYAGHSPVDHDGLAEPPTGTDALTTPQGGSSSHGAGARLLQAIGRRGGWSLDALIEKLDLPAHVVASALTQLELGGTIRYRDFAYHPV